MSQNTYSSVPAPGSPSHSEAWALTEAARRISIALDGLANADDIARPAAKRAVRDAVRLNWRLWTIFQAELTLETNPIPLDVRQNMLTLCQFVDNHTIVCMSELNPEQVKTLITINRNIAQGLLEGVNAPQPGTEDPAQEGEQQPPASGGTLNTNA